MSYTGADLIAEGLAQLGIEHVFGIVSIHNLPIFDAINRLGKTKIIDVRHEQAGTHAADGYARATGKLGVMLASTGPGTSNTVTGLYEAQYASSRVLLITTQADTKYYGKGVAYAHEAEKQVPMLESVCRRVESPRYISQLGEALQTVINDIYTGRPAPGAIEIPLDLQRKQVQPVNITYPTSDPLNIGDKQIADLSERLEATTRRLLIAGGGVIAANASTEFQTLAEKLKCPVITTEAGRGAIPENHPLCIGNYYASRKIYQAIRNADITLAVGTKFAVGIEGMLEAFVPPGDLIQIDIDGGSIGRTHNVSMGIQADAKTALAKINSVLEDIPAPDEEFSNSVWKARDELRLSMRKRLGDDFVRIMDSIRSKLPDNGVFVRDQTVSAYNWGNQQFPILQPRTSIHLASGALGPGLAVAIGAAIGTDNKTLVVHGDGGVMFHATELATAAQYNVPVVICVFNDSGYGVLRWMQHEQFGRISETDLGKVAFAQMAHSMGVPAERVKSVEEFDTALNKAISIDGPYLIDIDMEHFAPMQMMTRMPEKSVEVDIKPE